MLPGRREDVKIGVGFSGLRIDPFFSEAKEKFNNCIFGLNQLDTVDERNPAPVDRLVVYFFLFTGFVKHVRWLFVTGFRGPTSIIQLNHLMFGSLKPLVLLGTCRCSLSQMPLTNSPSLIDSVLYIWLSRFPCSLKPGCG